MHYLQGGAAGWYRLPLLYFKQLAIQNALILMIVAAFTHQLL
jgi:hypothetical protein